MKGWLAEEVLRRVLRNAGLLGAGKVAGTVLHLACLALTARLLGPAAFGLLILVRSYAQAASGIARFQSWQVLIRFGAHRVESGDREGFRDLAALTAALDATSGTVAVVAAILLAPAVGSWVGIEAEAIGLVQIYCLAIPLMTSATPTGILRIFDRFDRLAWQNLVTPSFRLAGIGIAFLLGAPFWALVLAWFLSDVAGEVFLWQQAWGELKRRHFLAGSTPSPLRAVRENQGLVAFSLAANGAATVTQASTPMFTLYVGALFGPLAAGAYRVAQVVLEAASTPGELAMRSLFPELARLLAGRRAEFRSLFRRALFLCTGTGLLLALLVAFGGPPLVAAAMGAEHGQAAALLPILALSLAPALAALPAEAALLALGRAGRVLLVRGAAAALTFAATALLAPTMGFRSIGIAVTLGCVVALAGLLLPLASIDRERPAHPDG